MELFHQFFLFFGIFSQDYASVGTCIKHVSHIVSDISWHLLDFRVVKLFNVLQDPLVIERDKVDGHALSTEPSATSNPAKIRKLSCLYL